MRREINVKLNKTVILNEELTKDQKISNQQLLNIIKLHQMRMLIEKAMTLAEGPILIELNNTWVNIQKDLQKNWNFRQDPNYIRFWSVPQCACPKRDNEERYPYGFIVSSECPIHGNNLN